MNSNVFAMRTSGGSVKVVFEGNHYLKTQNAEEIYSAAQELRTEDTEENRERLRNLLDPNYREAVMSGLERDNVGNLYLEGYSQPLGEGMAALIEEHHERGFSLDPFKRFWKRLQLNPNEKARRDFFEYVRDFGLTITREGYVILYKAVNRNPHADLDNDFVEFVGREYLKHQVGSTLPNPEEVFVVETEDGEHEIQDEIPKKKVFLNVGDLSVLNLVREAEKRHILNTRKVRNPGNTNGFVIDYGGENYSLHDLQREPNASPVPEIRDDLREEVLCPRDVLPVDFGKGLDELLSIMEEEGIIDDYHLYEDEQLNILQGGGSRNFYSGMNLEIFSDTQIGKDLAEELAVARPDLVTGPLETFAEKQRGTLAEVYTFVADSSDAAFEPWYSNGNYGNEINLGEMVSMPREECDPDSSISCSKGLHVGSHKYVQSFGSGKDVILACVVSPRDIVALPDTDHSKVRFCRYLPYAVMEREDDGSWEEIESVQVSTGDLEKDFDAGKTLKELKAQEDLTGAQEDRKRILEERVQQIS